MMKPSSMSDEEWHAFAEYARTEGVDADGDPDDVQVWLDFWQAGVAWLRGTA